MKFCSMNGPSESEVESLLMSPCWGPAQNGSSQDQYLLEGHKLLLEHDLDSLPSDTEQGGGVKNSLDVLDNLLLNTSSLSALNCPDLKPLPPFTGYTGHLSINGISGHHYHAIAQRLPEETNNNYIQSAYQTHHPNAVGSPNAASAIQLAAATSGTSPTLNYAANGGGGATNSHCGGGSSADHNIVSSSTCLPESVLSSDPDVCLRDVKLFADSHLESKLYSVPDSCVMSAGGGAGGSGAGGVRIYADAKDLSEYVDMNSIDDIAAIIGSAIADTTVPNQMVKEEGNDTRDSWMDLDAWIDGNCIQPESGGGKLIVSQPDALSDFMLPHSPVHASSSTLQSLLTHGCMPLLQNRLQNGPSSAAAAGGGGMKAVEAPSSTSYCSELATAATSTSSSPPGSVVSTTENLMTINPRYLSTSQHQQQQHQQQQFHMKGDALCSRSPDMLGNYPHTTTATPSGTPKAKRSRSQKKSSSQQQSASSSRDIGGGGGGGGGGPQQLNAISASTSSAAAAAAVSFNANDLSGLLGKEKPVHRCSICNRGFLNKSNIKVHLRTHTGEKPFRCDVCAKAFRQKAHLLKHQQIHKRIGRD